MLSAYQIEELVKKSDHLTLKVEDLIKRLFIGNGKEALDKQVSDNTAHRKKCEKEKEINIMFWIKTVGWIIAIAGILVGLFR